MPVVQTCLSLGSVHWRTWEPQGWAEGVRGTSIAKAGG